ALPPLQRGPGALPAVPDHPAVPRRQHAALRRLVPPAAGRRLPRLRPGRQPAHRLHPARAVCDDSVSDICSSLNPRRWPAAAAGHILNPLVPGPGGGRSRTGFSLHLVPGPGRIEAVIGMNDERPAPPRPRCRSLMGVRILGTGSYVPDAVVSNDHLHERFGFDSAWIVKRTGILERRHALPHQATSDLCHEAALRCLASSAVPPGDIDRIVLATLTPHRPC